MEVCRHDRGRRQHPAEVSPLFVAVHVHSACAVGRDDRDPRDLRHQIEAERDRDMDGCRPERLSSVITVLYLGGWARSTELAATGTRAARNQSTTGRVARFYACRWTIADICHGASVGGG